MLNVAQFIAVWNVWCFSKLIICISSTVAKVHAVNSAPSNVYLIQQRSSNVSVLIGIYNYCLCRVRPRVASVSQFYNSLYLTLPTNNYLPTYRVSQKKLGSQNFQIAIIHSFLKLKSIVIPLNQMSRSGEKICIG